MLNGALVLALALVAGGTVVQALTLGAGMLSIHLAIGGLNDVVDAPVDARVKPGKPIPAGLVDRRIVLAAVVVLSGLAVAIGALHGPVVLGCALGILAAGVAYDLRLKPTPFAALAYAVAFTLLPVYAWFAVTQQLPPRSELLLPVAALAGPTIQLANGLVDLEGDRSAGLRGPAVVLGPRVGWILLALLEAAVHGLAWVTLLSPGSAQVPAAAIASVAAGTTLAVVGVAGSGSGSSARRERGWQSQAVGLVLLGAGWVLAAT